MSKRCLLSIAVLAVGLFGAAADRAGDRVALAGVGREAAELRRGGDAERAGRGDGVERLLGNAAQAVALLTAGDQLGADGIDLAHDLGDFRADRILCHLRHSFGGIQ